MAKYTDLCNEILENVGGKDNISNALHCMTRLRLNVKDKSKVQVENVKKIKGVVGAQFSGEQFQVIIGQHVSDVYPEFCSIAGLSAAEAVDEVLDKEPFNIKKIPANVLDAISGTMAPLLPILMGAGFMKLFYSLLGPDLLNVLPNEAALMQILYIVGNAGIYYLPVFAAYSAAKKFNTSIALAMFLSVLLIDPNIINIVNLGETFKIYGLIPMPLLSYSSQFLPTLITVWVLSYVYKWVNKIMPQAIKIIGVPFVSLLIMVPLMFCVLAPIGYWIGSLLAMIIEGIYSVAGPFAIAIIAAFWPFMVATGMHTATIPIAINNISTLGCDPLILAGSNIANYALMGMTVAYFIRTKGEEKQMASANCITLIVGGISEPTLFSILLRNKRAMLTQIIGGFIGGLVGGILGVAVYTLGASNFLTVLQYAGGPGSNFTNAVIACVIAFVASTVVGVVLGFGDIKEGEGLASFRKKSKKA